MRSDLGELALSKHVESSFLSLLGNKSVYFLDNFTCQINKYYNKVSRYSDSIQSKVDI